MHGCAEALHDYCIEAKCRISGLSGQPKVTAPVVPLLLTASVSEGG